jgi:GNAT superfamily N-acetyltransferase
VVGGIIAETYYGWCHIDLLWVREDLRGRGLGRRLMDHAEKEALSRGAKGVYLDTFSFQAPEFYTRLGYETFGMLPDFPPGHERHFMVKHLD